MSNLALKKWTTFKYRLELWLPDVSRVNVGITWIFCDQIYEKMFLQKFISSY
jgi:hypothetical protein